MDLGEKIATIQEVIYINTRNELLNSGFNDTLSTIVMEGVFRRFQEAAYKESLLNMLQAEKLVQNTKEEHTGTPEELFKQVQEVKNDGVSSTIK